MLDSKISPLPAALPSMWRALKRAHEAEPRLLIFSFSLTMLAALPDALLALWLKVLADGLQSTDQRRIFAAAAGFAVSIVATWFLKVTSDRAQRRFRDRVSVALESHVARLQASISTIAHQERPEVLDRLSMLRNQVFVLEHMYMSLFATCGWILRLIVTITLLISVHPALALLAICAIPTVVTSSWRPGVERAVMEKSAVFNRLARHLFLTATTAGPAKEVRVARLKDWLIAKRHEAWSLGNEPVAATVWTSALWHAAAWALFAAAYVGGIVFVASRPDVSAGSILLVLAAGARLSAYVGATVGEVGFLRGFWLDGSQRMAWLEDYAASQNSTKDLVAPQRLTKEIRFDHVSFSYPGTDRLVLDDVTFSCKAGSVVAIVGENGAGKSTLVKLLCQLYQPSQGCIFVDDASLAEIPSTRWREKLAGAFQDFFRFELRAGQTVGLGDLPNVENATAIHRAVSAAGATDVVDRLASGLNTQLGPTWPNGVEVSFGQWQKLALARGFMREHPLLLILDEPTAALDAETEHTLFESYSHAARAGTPENRVTILISHRFSTVRMADQIVVMDGARVVETGSHEDLMAKRGQYATLYEIQTAAYR